MSVKNNLKAIQDEIKQACENAGRDPERVRIIAVTKYVSAERAREALEAGILDLGENRDEGILDKSELLGDSPVWHFIGTLQTRKVKNVIGKIAYLHSMDRLSLAKEVDRRARRIIKCLIQVNVSGEESKHGLEPSAVLDFVKDLGQFPNIRVEGLMTMAPFTNDEQLLRNCFRELKKLQLAVQSLNLEYAPCTELSMGMSNDYRIAVEEGATMVRIGTALVGHEAEVESDEPEIKN